MLLLLGTNCNWLALHGGYSHRHLLACSEVAVCHLHVLISYHQFTLLTIQCLHNDKDFRGLLLETFAPVSTTFAELVWVEKQPETLELADRLIVKALPNFARASFQGSCCIFGSTHASRVRADICRRRRETGKGSVVSECFLSNQDPLLLC
jgi:hypothetical protein